MWIESFCDYREEFFDYYGNFCQSTFQILLRDLWSVDDFLVEDDIKYNWNFITMHEMFVTL
jgi:hypothetical protein